jgi:hypothetical protein
MRKGLDSGAFRAQTTALRDRWCRFVHEPFDENVRDNQQGLTE